MSNVCDMPDATELQESSSHWVQSRTRHLADLEQYEVHDCLPLPHGVKAMSCRWVDRDDATSYKSRLTVRGFEQRLERTEDFYSSTPCAATLPTMLVTAHVLGLSVSVGDGKNAFIQSPFVKQRRFG